MNLDSSVVAKYHAIFGMIGKGFPDSHWEPFLDDIVGWTHLPKSPLPVFDDTIKLSVEELVIAHLVIYSGFIEFILHSEVGTVTTDKLETIKASYDKLARRGGFQIYFTGGLSFNILLFGLVNRSQPKDDFELWKDVAINPVYEYDAIDLGNMNDWFNEMMALAVFAERVKREIDNIPAQVMPNHKTLYYNSSGFMGLLPQAGEVTLIRSLSSNEIDNIHYLGSDLAMSMSEIMVRCVNHLNNLEKLNQIEFNLVGASLGYVQTPSQVVEGLKLLEQAIGFKLFLQDKSTKTTFDELNGQLLLERISRSNATRKDW